MSEPNKVMSEGRTQKYERKAEANPNRSGDTKTFYRKAPEAKPDPTYKNRLGHYEKGLGILEQAKGEKDAEKRLSLYNLATTEFGKAKKLFVTGQEDDVTVKARRELTHTYKKMAILNILHYKEGGNIEASRAYRLAAEEYRKLGNTDESSTCFKRSKKLKELAEEIEKKAGKPKRFSAEE